MRRYIGLALLALIIAVCRKKPPTERASELIQKGKFAEAVTMVKKALTTDSLNPDLYYRLCEAYIGLDSLRPAAWAYLRLYQIDSVKADSEDIKVYLADLAGLEPYYITRLTRTRSNEYSPYPSPDGLYFGSSRYRRLDIYLLRGKRVRRVIKGGGWRSNPVPVKGGICYSSGLDRDEEVYFYSRKQRKSERLTNNEEGDYPTGASPDG
ncbi:MAG TPA: hypothetical protein EYP24_04510, partial [bacterium (Candidatus Stahlbacteria)]|nr:hypothetical protein [Candidatus Stahlbacteria bacterium]